jgi:drug/metabolite transporter (DMT)-like permease
MTAPALTLVLIAAVLHAVWNTAAKRVQSNGYTFVWWYNLFTAVLGLPLGAVIVWQAHWQADWSLLLASLVSALFHIAYQLSLQTGYAHGDLNVVYPVARGTGPLLTMLVAIVFLHERPGIVAAFGGLILIGGIAIVTTGSPVHGGKKTRAGLIWGALTGIAIAAYTLWDDHSVANWALLPVPYFVLSCTWQTLLLTPGLIRRAKTVSPVSVLRVHWREVVVVGLLSPLAYILVLYAMQTVPVSLVAPARETSIIVGSLLAWLLFREPHPARRLLGALVVAVGIACIVV